MHGGIPFARDPVKNLSQLLLPAIILGFALSASVMRMTRSMVLEVLREDYVRTAWAKGLPESRVIARHVLKNAMIPVVTLIGLQAAFLLGGAVLLAVSIVPSDSAAPPCSRCRREILPKSIGCSLWRTDRR